jgi:hypothetical protein
MSSITQTYSVDPASSFWTPGPVGVTMTQTLVVKASGHAQWSSAPFYSQVEGAYKGFAQSHHLDPADASRPNPAAVVTNVPALSMPVLAMPSGQVPGELIPGQPGRGDALVPRWTLDMDRITRVATFYPSDMANKTKTFGPWDIFFAYVDGLYADNAGMFTVTTVVTDVDLQPAGEVLGLPGHMTQEDIDSAGFCSFSGLLTPGNRLRDIDDRFVADVFAAHCYDGELEF